MKFARLSIIRAGCKKVNRFNKPLSLAYLQFANKKIRIAEGASNYETYTIKTIFERRGWREIRLLVQAT